MMISPASSQHFLLGCDRHSEQDVDWQRNYEKVYSLSSAKRTWRRSCPSCGSRSVSITSACSSRASGSMPTITPTHTNTATGVVVELAAVATADTVMATPTEQRCPRSRTAACRPNSIGRGRIGAEDTPEEVSRSVGTKSLSNFRRGPAPTERPRERERGFEEDGYAAPPLAMLVEVKFGLIFG